MTQKRDNRGFDRRSVLKSLSAGTATVATGGVAAASGTPSNDESPLTEEERAERRAPYEDLGTARSLVSDNTERLLERLADRGYLPAGRARALQMNRLETGFRKAAKQSQRGHNDVRVKTVHHENFGTKVIVDTK